MCSNKYYCFLKKKKKTKTKTKTNIGMYIPRQLCVLEF